MKNKYTYFLKKLNAMICTILFLALISINTNAIMKNTDSNKELNWYFVNKGKDKLPEAPQEALNLLGSKEAYYLGDSSSKNIYLKNKTNKQTKKYKSPSHTLSSRVRASESL